MSHGAEYDDVRLEMVQQVLTLHPHVDRDAVFHAASTGFLGMTEWLKHEYPDIDQRALFDYAISKACRAGWPMAQYLLETCPVLMLV